LRGGLGRGGSAKIATTAIQSSNKRTINSVRIDHHILIGKAQHLKPSPYEIRIARRIVTSRQSAAMRVAINFDNDPSMQAREIDIIGTKLDLFAEMPAIGSQRIDQPPEPALDRTGLTSEFSP